MSWREVTDERIVRARIYTHPTSEAEPRAYIGTVLALANPPQFHPKAVYLEDGRVEQDVVIFRASGNGFARSWRIADQAILPDWFFTEWSMEDGKLMLRVALKDGYQIGDAAHFRIPLVRDDGAADELQIAAFPAR
ncbi:MAG: hypothetical protein KY475_03445 [Planctomycetes bacterium]|nr:hypothetical protein [Planctomycetota bacterium]